MKAVSGTDAPVVRGSATASSSIKVCMHVLGTARTDVRVMREATALAKEGYSVSIVDVESDRTHPVEEEIRGIRVKHIMMPSWFVSTRFKPWFLAKATWILICGILRLIRTPADIYHAHDEQALPACYIVARLRHKLLIFDAHEWPFSAPSMKRWRRLCALATGILTRMVPSCARVITVSPPLAQEIRHLYSGSEVSVIRSVPVYRTIPASDQLRQLLNLSPNMQIALYQGNIQSDRELGRLIRAAAFLEQGNVIVIMGKGSKGTLSELQMLIANEGVGDRVKIIPPVPYEELLNWTASADIGLIVYSPDSSLNIRFCLPNKFFEYLMAGVPVLATQLDAIIEVIKAYDVGKIIPSLAPVDIGAAINAMLADRVLLDHLHHNALTAAKEFCWEKENQQLIRLYHDILAKSSEGVGSGEGLSPP